MRDAKFLLVVRFWIAPGGEALEQEWPATADEVAQASPFAGLAALKKRE